MSENKIRVPWTTEQVAQLNRFQRAGIMHPFTCPRVEHDEVLVATPDGWVCPTPGCDYTQAWAHDFMANRGWISMVIARTPWLREPEVEE